MQVDVCPTGRVNIDRQNARYLAGGIGSGFCSSLKETVAQQISAKADATRCKEM